MMMPDAGNVAQMRSRYTRLGMKQVNVWVPVDEAPMVGVEAELSRAKHIVKIVDEVHNGSNGIEDERFDAIMEILGNVTVGHKTMDEMACYCATTKDHELASELWKKYHELSALMRQERLAEKRYENADMADKFDAAVDWHIAKARVYAYGRLLRAEVRMFKEQRKHQFNEEGVVNVNARA